MPSHVLPTRVIFLADNEACCDTEYFGLLLDGISTWNRLTKTGRRALDSNRRASSILLETLMVVLTRRRVISVFRSRARCVSYKEKNAGPASRLILAL